MSKIKRRHNCYCQSNFGKVNLRIPFSNFVFFFWKWNLKLFIVIVNIYVFSLFVYLNGKKAWEYY